MSNLAQRAKLELAWRKAKSDILWCSTLWWIQHPRGSRTWELYDSQKEILTLWASGEHALHLKARQLGFSTSVGFYAWWRAYFNDDVKALLLSKGERESTELLDKVKFGLERLPDWMKDRGPKIENWTQSKITFSNGSEILSLPSANNPARGFTGALIVVDEWGFLINGEEAWASIEPTADIGGQIIGLSTANGVGNIFHTLWLKAIKGKSMFTAKFYPWSAVPGRDENWYARKAENLLPWQLHQEYPTTAEEAFIRSGTSVFDISKLMELPVEEPLRYRIEGASTSEVGLVHNPEGEVRVWRKPEHGRTYVLGVDVAEGLVHGDYSSIHVIDYKTREIVAAWHGHIPADLLSREVHGLGSLYNKALVCIEANNHGLTTITMLRQLRYPRIWRRRTVNKATNKVTLDFGFRTTRGTKAPLVDGLGAWLRETNDEAPRALVDPDLKSELLTFVRKDNGSMSGSPHDDRVISAALAVMMLEYAHQPEYKITVDDTNTLAWWARKGLDEEVVETGGIRPLRAQTLVY